MRTSLEQLQTAANFLISPRPNQSNPDVDGIRRGVHTLDLLTNREFRLLAATIDFALHQPPEDSLLLRETGQVMAKHARGKPLSSTEKLLWEAITSGTGL